MQTDCCCILPGDLGFTSTEPSLSSENAGMETHEKVLMERAKMQTCCCHSLRPGSHCAPQFALQASEEAFDVSFRCVFQKALCSVFLARQPGVRLVQVRVQACLWVTAVQQVRGRRRALSCTGGMQTETLQ